MNGIKMKSNSFPVSLPLPIFFFILLQMGACLRATISWTGLLLDTF